MKTNINIDGIMILSVAAVAGAVFLYTQKEKILAAVNPASDENIIKTGQDAALEAATGGSIDSAGDFFWETRAYNPTSWIFEGLGRLTGDL